jgi:Methyltransferase domain
VTVNVTAPPPVHELADLRRFVTLLDLDELDRAPERFAGYLHAFAPDEDATLLVHGPPHDQARADTALARLREAAGLPGEAASHVVVCLFEEDPAVRERLSRRAHAVLSEGRPDWLLVSRPVYAPEQIPELRRHAVRHCGGRDEETVAPYSYDAAIDHLVRRGWTTERHTRMGSIPVASLERAVEVLTRELPAVAPRLLHVGNFLGVSLSYVLDWARGRDGVVVSVDPNIPHRGVEEPQDAVCDLLAHFGLAENHLLMCGYSLGKSLSNDGVVFDDYDPASAWSAESAPENVLLTLRRLGHRFDAAFIDGNHDPDYLRAEIAHITEMLVPGGLLVLDDVDAAWEQIRGVFDEVVISDWPLEAVCADGRIGILRRPR